MWGRKIRPRRLSAIFLPGIFLLPPIFERILLIRYGSHFTRDENEFQLDGREIVRVAFARSRFYLVLTALDS
jgi:hypothetical protein